MIAIRLDIQNPEAFSAPWEVTTKAAGFYVGQVARATVKEMRKIAPKGKRMIHPLSKRGKPTRNLARQITVVKDRLDRGLDSFAIVAPSRVDHARFVMFGTSPHQIDIRRARSLTIYKPGGYYDQRGKHVRPDKYGWIHLRTTKHPGNRGNDFRFEAIANLKSKDILGKAWRESFDKAWAWYQGGGKPKGKP